MTDLSFEAAKAQLASITSLDELRLLVSQTSIAPVTAAHEGE